MSSKILAISCRPIHPLIWLFVLLLAACSADPRPLQEAVEVEDLGLAYLRIESEETTIGNTVINPRQSIQFTFKAFNQDNEEIIVENRNRRWTVSNSDIAEITDSGLLTGKFDGELLIGLRIGGIVADPVPVLISSAELVDIAEISGEDELSECSRSNPYTATGSFSDGSIRQLDDLDWRVVSSASGRLLTSDSKEAEVGALQTGSVTLYAKSGEIEGEKTISVISGLDSLVISPSPAEVERSANLQLAVRATYSIENKDSQSVTNLATWEVDDDVASVSDEVDSKGLLRGLVIGQTQVMARCAEQAASAEVSVIEPQTIVSLRVEPSDDPVIVYVNGENVQLRVFALSSRGSDEEVTDIADWSVESGEDKIVVDNTADLGGRVTALEAGLATIKVSYANISQTVSILVR